MSGQQVIANLENSITKNHPDLFFGAVTLTHPISCSSLITSGFKS